MKHNAGSTLLTTNKLGDITETDQHYLEAVKAFARLSYESIYVIDYKDMSFEYVSENPLFLCGYSAAEVLQLGYEFYFRQVPPQDMELLSQLNEAGFEFYAQLPVEERILYSITYDFHLRHKNGKQILINHKLTPLFLTPEGKMWKSMCVVSLSRQQAAGNVRIYRQGSNEMWELSIGKKSWQKLVKPSLTERELDVLRLHAQGFSIDQIAEKLFVAPDTVKYYRRKIFERLEVGNVMDALSFAVASKLI
ncbi:helix-turn-helix transcriptional regulator [Chitinophaga sp. CC14]|uniref:response regulator transcription factor n=1 Tax=Chitinophaga sp. CC14 TaxID=3029199 RepID=UPI003B78F2B2